MKLRGEKYAVGEEYFCPHVHCGAYVHNLFHRLPQTHQDYPIKHMISSLQLDKL